MECGLHFFGREAVPDLGRRGDKVRLDRRSRHGVKWYRLQCCEVTRVKSVRREVACLPKASTAPSRQDRWNFENCMDSYSLAKRTHDMTINAKVAQRCTCISQIRIWYKSPIHCSHLQIKKTPPKMLMSCMHASKTQRHIQSCS
jgi:hypothetical protein